MFAVLALAGPLAATMASHVDQDADPARPHLLYILADDVRMPHSPGLPRCVRVGKVGPC